MSKILDRTAVGAFAFLLAVAVADVSTARAQTAGPPITPTACGAGVLDPCGTQTLFHCEWKISFNFLTLPYGAGFTFYEVCTPSGSKPLYKDVLGTLGAPRCGASSPLGPPGYELPTEFGGDGTCEG